MDVNKTKNKIKESIMNVGNEAKIITGKSKEFVNKEKDEIMKKMDVNNDGQVDINDVIIAGLRIPGIKIDRKSFLNKEFSKKYSSDIVDKAIMNNPSEAGIKIEDINKIADEVIKYERNCVSGISAALGMPGGVAIVATLPTDIAQYYGYMLRATQKLMYLYGFPDIDLNEDGNVFDTETLNVLTICLGVMYGVAGANSAIKAMANGLAKGVGKKIMSTALTKGTLYPIVKSVAKWFGIKMTKSLLSGVVQKSIPIIGGVIGGGITYASFKPCCDKLKNTLEDTMLSNPNHILTKEEKEIIDEVYYEVKDETVKE